LSSGTTGRTITDIESSHTAYKIVLHSPEQYYLLENKYVIGNTWTAGLPGSGLLITHIHDNVITSYLDANSINDTNSRSHGVNVVEADNDNELWTYGLPYGEAKDLFYSGNKTSISPSTSPNSNYYTATSSPYNLIKTGSSGVSITNISAAGSTMTFDY